ncbi:MAG: aminotransferase class I/II-fold pyridoxal phosphate-dependent enzyme [Pseudomonadota bacterium]|nr:aminotransferase class I/II-fold pyridoxal phosphate-dependent enzyme [Pseudomonadota bacterium]
MTHRAIGVSETVPISQRGHLQSTGNLLAHIAMDRVRNHQPVYRLDVGQPSDGAPQKALDALNQIDHIQNLGYTVSVGQVELRERIAKHYQQSYGISVSANEIACCVGASQALAMVCFACLDVGDTMAIVLPCYPAYRDIFNMSGLAIHDIITSLDNDFKCTAADIQALPKGVKAILITNPSNPTGAIYTQQELLDIHQACQEKDILLISDEIYHGVVYDGLKVFSMAGMANTVVINSFSKYYAMPGWRLGWVTATEEVVSSISNMSRSWYISPPNASQVVALHAMDCQDELNQHIIKYEANRALLMDQLPKMGMDHFIKPSGAFYVYARIKHLKEDSIDFCKQLLTETGVCIAPGSLFDHVNGHHDVRISYAGTTSELQEALEKMADWMSKKFN